MKTLTMNVLAGSAVAAMLLPMAASAHGLDFAAGASFGKDNNPGLHLGAVFGVRAGDNDNATSTRDNDNDRGDHGKAIASSTVAFQGNASTTAARLTAKANRVSTIADLLGSLSSTIAAKITGANLSASSTAAANAKLGDYNTSVAGAKTQATAALSAAATVNANNSTTTNATLTAEAKGDLSAAQQLLRTAGQDLHYILGLIFKA